MVADSTYQESGKMGRIHDRIVSWLPNPEFLGSIPKAEELKS